MLRIDDLTKRYGEKKAAPYLFLGAFIGLTVYLAVWLVIYASVSLLLYRWLNTKGAEAFSKL